MHVDCFRGFVRKCGNGGHVAFTMHVPSPSNVVCTSTMNIEHTYTIRVRLTISIRIST